MISGENPFSIKGLHLMNEIQISRQMTIYGQTEGAFKLETMNVLATEKRQIGIKSFTYVVLSRVFRHKYVITTS